MKSDFRCPLCADALDVSIDTSYLICKNCNQEWSIRKLN